MPAYKCPACGRSHLELHEHPTAMNEAGISTLPGVHTEARCRDCGWFGTVDDLKISY